MALSLFTVFHANLAFSSIPPADVGRVIDRCLWPLLDLAARSGVPLGLEMPGDSLATVAATDPPCLAALREAAAAGRLEVVGSGLVQAILPLVPAAVGAHDLRRGRDVYCELLGRAPRLAYLHEQTYAAGLVALYRDAGYAAMVAEWENPASAHGWPERLRYRAAWVEGTGGARIACLWNSSVLFQRVQRYAHGEIDLEEVLALLATHHDAVEARTLCLYGNDCEVFDYRPGAPGLRYAEGPAGEWARLATLLEALGADRRFALVLPSEALARHPPAGPALRLESAAVPLPTKKQAKYNVTRWAVCGRTNARLNAACHALHRRLEVVAALARAGGGRAAVPEAALARHADELVRLWGSDLRTHTTDERAADAARRTGALAAALDALVVRLEPALLSPPLGAGEVALFNPWPTPWAGWPVAVRASFPPGLLPAGVRVTAGASELPAQAEEVERYRDGSIRRALLVVAPVLPPLGVARLACRPAPLPPPAGAHAAARIETAAATAVLAARRGAALATLAFPRLSPLPLAGTVPQGAFAPIELAADWYTGNLVLYDADGAKHTDLEPTVLVPLAAPEACPVRIPVVARLTGPYGELWKTVYVYREVPRIDLRYHLAFDDQRPRSLSLGILTVNPDAFVLGRLRYTTVNGGRDVETFPLGRARVALHEPVGFAVSARGCLGATEGWVDVGDDVKGVTLAWDPAALAAAPLVQHEPAGERALTRLFLSLVESDETAAPFFRGETTFTVAYLGRGADPDETRRQAVAAARGLHVLGGAGG
jgi:hypothetical protein